MSDVRTYDGVPPIGAFGSRTGTPLVIDIGSNVAYFVNDNEVVTPLAGSGGTVASVGLAAPSQFAVSGSPVTSAGTLTLAWNNQTANRVLAGPSSGVAAQPTFRALVSADLPVGTGTVTSVAQTVPVEFSVAGSPVTTSGTLAITKATQSANQVWAGPTTGAAAQPLFRALVNADLPSGTGNVVGTPPSTDNAIARYDGITGLLIQNSAAFLDDSGRILTGDATARNIVGITASIQALGTTQDASAMAMAYWANDVNASNFMMGKARGSPIGTNTIVQNGDFLGSISFAGANGSTFDTAANIAGVVDGTPGASNDMPGMIVFRTTPDGSGTAGILTRMQVRASGRVLINTTAQTASLGNVQIGTTSDTTNAAGILFGTDTQMHRSAANVLQIPDTLVVSGAEQTPPVTFSNTQINGAGALINYVDAGRTANNKIGVMQFSGGDLYLGFFNDASSASTRALVMTGGHAAGISLLTSPNAVSNVFGHTASVTVGNAGKMQVSGTTAAASQIQASGYAADATTAGTLALSKSRHATNGSNTIVQSGDIVASVVGYGANGSTYTAAGNITVEINGTPGATTDMPGRIVARATPDGSGTPLEVWRAVSVASAVNGFNFSNAAAAANPVLSVIGSDTDIDLGLTPKGAGLVKFGAFTTLGVEVGAGTISIKDSGGTTRKLLVVA